MLDKEIIQTKSIEEIRSEYRLLKIVRFNLKPDLTKNKADEVLVDTIFKLPEDLKKFPILKNLGFRYRKGVSVQ